MYHLILVFLLFPLVLAAYFDLNIWQNVMSCNIETRGKLACTCKELRNLSGQFWRFGLNLEGLETVNEYHPDLEVYSSFQFKNTQQGRDLAIILLLSTVRKVVHDTSLAEKIYSFAVHGLLNHPDPLSVLREVTDNEKAINELIKLKMEAGQHESVLDFVAQVRELYLKREPIFKNLTPAFKSFLLEDPKRFSSLFPLSSPYAIEELLDLAFSETQFRELLQEYLKNQAEMFVGNVLNILNYGQTDYFMQQLVKARMQIFYEMFDSAIRRSKVNHVRYIMMLRGIIDDNINPNLACDPRVLAHALLGGKIDYFKRHFAPNIAELIIKDLHGPARQEFIGKVLADSKLRKIYSSVYALSTENRELLSTKYDGSLIKYLNSEVKENLSKVKNLLVSEGSDEEIAVFFKRASKDDCKSFFDILNFRTCQRTPEEFVRIMCIFLKNRQSGFSESWSLKAKTFIAFHIKRMDYLQALTKEEQLITDLQASWLEIHVSVDIYDQFLSSFTPDNGIIQRVSYTAGLERAFLSRYALKKYTEQNFTINVYSYYETFNKLFYKSIDHSCDGIRKKKGDKLRALVKLLPFAQIARKQSFRFPSASQQQIERLMQKFSPKVQLIFKSIKPEYQDTLRNLLCNELQIT